ncbi:MAG: hypothetical protein ACI854_000125 [Arenicella sp.]|jgi:uncharacterized protein YfaS (alpha-2-macroglobulin family)
MKFISNMNLSVLLSIATIFAADNLSLAQEANDTATFNPLETELNVLRITPQGKDVATSNRQIVFKFNQPVVSIGDMKRLAAQIPVTITPVINCQWLWLDSSSLACQLKREDQLKQATEYSITLKPGITTVSGSAMSQQLTHEFITQRPKLDNIYLSNWLNQNKPVASLYFNQPITKSSLEKHVQLQTNNGLAIQVIAERQENPLTDRHYRKPDIKSPFVELHAIPLGNSHESRVDAIKRANSERAGAYDQARKIWNITPAVELPENTNIRVDVLPGIQSVFGDQLGLVDLAAHRFKSLPPFEFLGVQCSQSISRAAINIKPLYSSEQVMRTGNGENSQHSIEECDPLNQIALVFSTPVSYQTARDGLDISPDLAGGRSEYDPWGARNDAYYLRNFFSRRFDYGDNDPYLMRLPESLKAFEQYRIKSNSNLVDELSRTTKSPINMSFLTAHRAPRLHYSHQHSVLEKNMQTEVPITVTNLESLKVNNYSRTTSTRRDDVAEFTNTLEDVQDIAYAVPLGVRKMLNTDSGIIVGTLASDPLPNDYSPDYYHFVSQVTPFQVHFKFGHFNSYAWVTDMSTGQPIEGVAVKLEVDDYPSIEPFGDQESAIKTDLDGVAVLPGIEAIDPQLEHLNKYNFTQSRIMLKLAKGDDLALLPLDYQYQSWSQVRHYLQTKNSYLHAWGTTAQGVYKAGDAIQYKLWVRNQDNRHWVAAPQQGYSLEVIDPKGQRVQYIENINLSDFGSFDGELTTATSASVGWYSFVLSYTDNDKTFKHYPMRVLVSDFTPSPFRVNTDLNGDQFQAGDAVAVTTLAKMHAGGPYADAETRVTARVSSRRFTSNHPKAKGFSFDHGGDNNASSVVHQQTGSVNKAGELLTEFKLKVADLGFHFGRIKVESAVRDDRGKYVASSASADYLGRDRFVGLRNTKWTHQVGKKASIEHLVVDAEGTPIDGQEVELIVEHHLTRAARVKGAGNAYLTQYTSQWVKTADCKQSSKDRRVSCEFTPKEPGRYRVTASIRDTKGRENKASLSTWVVGKGAVLWASINDSQIEIIADAKSYEIGDVAKFLIKNPYPGAEALITVERYGVKRHWRKTLVGNTPIIEVPIEDDDYPGIYLSVVVTSPRVAAPLADGNVDLGKPAFKMGYVTVPVNDGKKEIDISLKTNKKVYKPREKVRIKLKAKPRSGKFEPMEVAIVVIDEAVFDLNLSGKAYYDPVKGFNTLDDLGVANYNLLMSLIGRQKFEKKGANPGGGGGGEDGPSLRNLMKFVAYWNPAIKLDKKGRTEFDFELPDNLTGWRVFAMAVTKEEKMGLGDTNFQVNRPTELRPVMPNQLTEGDQVQAGFSVMNRTKKARILKVEIRAAGSALQTPLTKIVDVTLAPFERKRVWLEIKTDGPGELALMAKAGDSLDRDAVEHHVPVTKRGSLITAATHGTTVAESVSENFSYPQAIFPDVGGLSIEVSPSVIGSVAGAFQYLRDYPHGSWEQRLSKALAASQYGELKAYLPDQLEWPASATLAEQTLLSAQQFQAPNGGMTYWINKDQYVSPYLSAYTALGFVWLRDQGYEVPSEIEDKLHTYLKHYLRKDIKSDSTNQQSTRRLQASVRAVALAALAANGKIDKAELIRYQSHVADMDLFGKAHYLQAATSLKLEEQTLLNLSQDILSYSVQSGGKFQFSQASFYGASSIHSTPMRSNCAILTSLLEVSSTSKKSLSIIGDVPFKQVRAITQTRGGRDYWSNTQENLYCINALINFSQVYESEPPNIQLKAESVSEKYAIQTIGSAEFDDIRASAVTMANSALPVEAGLSGQMRLSKQGTGRVYYSMRMNYAKTEESAEPIHAGIQVKREYSVQRDDKWQLIKSPMQLKKGELVRVDLFVSSPTARQFVVINDPIPGGLEPVNRDLATASRVDASYSPTPGSHWFANTNWSPYGHYGWSFYHKELRHDSARFYSDYLPLGDYHLSYTAQAIAAGEFSVMPVKVEEMYDPDVYGLGLPAMLRVDHPGD